MDVNTIELPERSEWSCRLFGGTIENGMVWTPQKGQHPNWFWRTMQYLILGNKWVRAKKENKDE